MQRCVRHKQNMEREGKGLAKPMKNGRDRDLTRYLEVFSSGSSSNPSIRESVNVLTHATHQDQIKSIKNMASKRGGRELLACDEKSRSANTAGNERKMRGL